MNINATLIVQFIVFFILVLFTMKFVWPPLMAVLDERAKKISDGIVAAESGHARLRLIEAEIEIKMAEVQEKININLRNSEQHSRAVIEEARLSASKEYDRIVESAKVEVDSYALKIKDSLKSEFGALVFEGVRQVLERDVAIKDHQKIISSLQERL